ncbi:MAG: Verru_Chthon cassette protein B [Verrucomicrobiales bacterium]|nr:Verru_Chthon cassette protein B [Verrucomicrobiales bacterium]MED5586642.1 Verru_Chthon cassette protein B [Verrucomicrobiota bacterium]
MRSQPLSQDHGIAPQKSSVKRGFTLIETVLAIGIVATVLIALLGLLPTGSDILSEAGRSTVGARIAQQLIGEVQLAEYDDIDKFNNQQRFYNDMGTELRSGGDQVVYTARIEIESGNPPIPGAKESEYLRRVIIKVSNNPGNPDFTDPPAGDDGQTKPAKSNYNRYSTLVVFTGKDKS